MKMSAEKPLKESAAATDERKGFVPLPLRVVFDRALSPVDFRVLATIAAHDWGEGSAGCLLSYERIGELSVTSESSVKRSIKKLESLRYIFPPVARSIGGRRYATVIRVTNRVREDGVARPEPVPDLRRGVEQPALDGSSVAPFAAEASDGDGSSVDPRQKRRRGAARVDGSTVNPSQASGWVQHERRDGSTVSPITNTQENQQRTSPVVVKSFRPDIVREALLPGDSVRLRRLDALGCGDSADWLGLLLGALAKRERALGRDPEPMRLRAALDGALSARSVMRADNPLGFLLAGIERGFLLANPRSGAHGSNVDPSSFYALPITERAKAVVAVAHGRARDLPRSVVRVAMRLLAERPGLAGRVEAGEMGELET